MGGLTMYDQLVGLIYETALVPACWEDLLVMLARELKCEDYHLQGWDPMLSTYQNKVIPRSCKHV
ncbi:MAG TPA: hypothetical protein PK752_14765, partial [Accumulibacter sp.]|uniref:hypothetical protein n=1 Tax=Accumulibacter sp. TaxID=2053492 RepID=UPI002B7E737E